MLSFLIFVLTPLIVSLYLSVTNYNVLGAETKFVGLENFKHFVDGTDMYFFQSLKVTSFYVLLSVPMQIVFAFFLAWILSTSVKGRSIFPTIFFNLIMSFIGSFQVFSQAYIMTWGGPNNSSLFMCTICIKKHSSMAI